MKRVWASVRRRGGAAAVGYGLLVGLVALAILGAVAASGQSIARLLGMTANYISDPETIPGGPHLSAAPPAIDAGALTSTGNTPVLGAAVTVTVTDSGDRPTYGLAVSVSGDALLAYGGDGCSGRTLQPGESCAVSVQPRAVANGPLSGALHVSAGDVQLTVPVTGTGAGFVAALSLGSGDLAVASNGGGPGDCTALPVGNTGTARLSGLAFGGFGGAAAAQFTRCSDVAHACADGGDLTVGDGCNFGVALTAAQNGSYPASVTVTAAGGLSATRNLAGTASGLAAQPGLALAADAPSVAGTSPGGCVPVTLSNSGNAGARIVAAGIDGGAAHFALCAAGAGACAALPFDLAAAESCALGVQLSASANDDYTGNLTVDFLDLGSADGTQAGSAALALSGTASGLAASLAWRDATNAAAADGTGLGVDAAGQSGNRQGTPRSFTLANNGNGESAALHLTIQGSDYVLGDDACSGAVLAPGAGCAVRVMAIASGDKALAGTLQVGSDGPALALSGGAGGWPGNLAWTDADGSGFTVTGSSGPASGAAKNFTLSNTGAGTTQTVSVGLVAGGENFTADASACPTALAPGASCIVSVAPRASGEGSFGGTLRATQNGVNADLALTGSAAGWPGAPAWYAADGTGTADGSGFTVTGSSGAATGPARSFTLRNTGAGSATGLSVSIAAGSANFTVDTGNCPATLGVGASCLVSVTPKASTEGSFGGTLRVVQNGTNIDLALTGSASGWPGALAWYGADGTSAANGSGFTVAGSSGTASGTARSFTLRNTGAGSATAVGVSLPAGSANFAVDASACPATLGVGGGCLVSVTPRASGDGAFTGTLRGTAQNGTTGDLALAGSASGWPASLGWYAADGTSAAVGGGFDIAYTGSGGQVNGPTKTFVLKNTGAGTSKTWTAFGIVSTSGNFNILSQTCSGTLAPGASCSFTIQSFASGDKAMTALLRVEQNGVDTDLTLSGTASGWPASLAWYGADGSSAADGSFTVTGSGTAANVTGGTQKTFTLKNNGSGTARANTVAVSAPSSYASIVSGCSTLAPGASCSVTVLPSASHDGTVTGTLTATPGSGSGAGSTAATLAMTTTASGWSPLIQWVDGSGAAITSASYTMSANGAVNGNAYANPTFTLKNSGAGNRQVAVQIGTTSGNFFFTTNNCNRVLALNESCTVQLYSYNSNPGTYTATLLPFASGTPMLSLTATATGWSSSLSLSGNGSGMNVTGVTGTARTFSLANNATGSDTPTVVLTDTANFSITADTCNGHTVGRNETCSVTVTSRATAPGTLTSSSLKATASNGTSPAAIALNGTATMTCDSGWTFSSATGHCYRYTGTTATYAAAQSACQSAGGYLATITSSAEYNSVNQAISAGGGGFGWLGMQRTGSGNSFTTWDITGEPATFTAWYPGEPNGPSERCLESYDANYGYGWNDLDCASALGSTCEKNSH